MTGDSDKNGCLWVVATPIGNLDDMGIRALTLLENVEFILAEDSRNVSRLLRSSSKPTVPVISLHEHNEQSRIATVIQRLEQGESGALVSDAGTPLISDPGFRLVRALRKNGIAVMPVPGPCAAIAAVSVSGLPSDRFLVAGFPPSRASARRAWLDELKDQRATLVFYESIHRIEASLADMIHCLGGERGAFLGREMTKIHETYLAGSLVSILEHVTGHPDQRRGECVVVVQGRGRGAVPGLDAGALLRELVDELPLKKAAAITSRVTGLNKNELYEQGLAIKRQADSK